MNFMPLKCNRIESSTVCNRIDCGSTKEWKTDWLWVLLLHVPCDYWLTFSKSDFHAFQCTSYFRLFNINYTFFFVPVEHVFINNTRFSVHLVSHFRIVSPFVIKLFIISFLSSKYYELCYIYLVVFFCLYLYTERIRYARRLNGIKRQKQRTSDTNDGSISNETKKNKFVNIKFGSATTTRITERNNRRKEEN